MNAPLFFRCFIALVVWHVPLCASAQIEPPADLGYDPPEGWEYIRNLDSLQFRLYAHNDTLYARLKNSVQNSPQRLEHSFDGGKTWSTATLPEITNSASTIPLHIQGTS